MEQRWQAWYEPLDIKARAALLDLINKHGLLAEAVQLSSCVLQEICSLKILDCYARI